MPSSDAFHQDARFRVMALVQDNPEMTQRQIADELGISLGAVNYCLRGLIEKGHVKLQNVKASRNKAKYIYLLTPEGIAEKARLTSNFLARRLKEYEALKAEIAALSAETDPISAQNEGRAR